MAITADDVEDPFGDRGEDLVDDVGVHHAPLAIAFIVGGDGANVALKTELAESRVEEEAPLAEVAFVHVEDDMYVMANGDALNV